MAEVCHKCNKPTRANAKFCASCGTRLNQESVQSPPGELVLIIKPAAPYTATKAPPPVTYTTPSSSTATRIKSNTVSATPSTTTAPSPRTSATSTSSALGTSAPASTTRPTTNSAPTPSSKSTIGFTPSKPAAPTSKPTPTSATSKAAPSSTTNKTPPSAATSKQSPTRPLSTSTPIAPPPSSSGVSPRGSTTTATNQRLSSSPTVASSPTSASQTPAFKALQNLRPLSLSAPVSPSTTTPAALAANNRLSSYDKDGNILRASAGSPTPHTPSPPSKNSDLMPPPPPPTASPRKKGPPPAGPGLNSPPHANSIPTSATAPKHISTPPTQTRPLSTSPAPSRFSAPAHAPPAKEEEPKAHPKANGKEEKGDHKLEKTESQKATISASLSTKVLDDHDAKAAAAEEEKKRKGSIRGMFNSIIRKDVKEEPEELHLDKVPSAPLKTSAEADNKSDTKSEPGEEPQRRKWFIKKTELSMVGTAFVRREPSHDPLTGASTPTTPSGRVKSHTFSSPATPTPNVAPSTPISSPALSSSSAVVAPPSPVPEKKKDQRERVIEEVIKTEEDYLRDLEIIISMKQMMKDDETVNDFVTTEDISAIFSCVEQLHALNSELNKIFQEGKDGASIGLGFISMAAYLKMYSVYCGNQNKSLDTIIRLKKQRKEFQQFLVGLAARPECRSLGLEDFLIKPVQRVCKYPLLLRELIKATPPTHPDAEKLQTAADKIGDIVADVNEKKRIFENLQTMYDVQMLLEDSDEEINILNPSRHLIKEGRIGFLPHTRLATLNSSSPSVTEGYFFLFNDLFLCMKRTVMGSQKLKIYIPLDKALIPPRQSFKSELPVFQIVEAGSAIWSFVASSNAECEQHVELITKYIDEIFRKKYVEEEKHKTNALSFEDFLKTHRDKPLPPPPLPKGKPKRPPTPVIGNPVLVSVSNPATPTPISPVITSNPISPSPPRKHQVPNKPPPPRPDAKALPEDENGKRKSLPPVPRTQATTGGIKFVCYYQDKRLVELPKTSPTFAQLKDKVMQKFSFQPNTFTISRHQGGKPINSQQDLEQLLEESKDILQVGVEVDITFKV